MNTQTILASILALALAGAARAADTTVSTPRNQPGVSTTVQTGDIDLATRAGARKMLGRIRRAAQSVCPSEEGDYIFLAAGIAHCQDKATADAVARLNAPVVTALYQGRPVVALASGR